jgi:phospholipid/cholesterol/gamma-HCH transport system substrate-binding protein
VAESTHSLRVGVLLLAAAVILAAAIFSVGGGVRWFSGTEELRAHFARVNGLQTGAPVYLSGVNIGTVAAIHFPKDPRANYVVVYLSVRDDAMPRVREDSVAKIESMGLLGDKFLLLTSGSPTAPSIQSGALLKSRDPVNYAALLETRGTSDLVANILAISQSVRDLLDSINRGHGVLAELIKGPSNPNEKPFTLSSLQQTMDNAARLSAQLDVTIERINHGQGVLGAMLSPRTDGRRIINNFASAATSLRTTSARLDQTSQQLDALVARMNNAHGVLPQLMEDQKYAGQLLGNLRRSSDDMQQILDKVNQGQGTLGLLVNDPSLYDKTTNLVSSSGWGVSLLKGLYSITHPFSSTSSPSYAPATRAVNYSPVNSAAPPSADLNSAAPNSASP